MPSIEEQDEIVKAIDGVDAKLSLYERKKANLQAIFRTLLHELMTAKTRANRQGSHDIPYR
jgi:type I restriction enzyme S subunit